MFANAILRLHQQGYTSGYIAHRLSLTPQSVRAVISADALPCGEAKAVYVETVKPAMPTSISREQRLRAAKRTRAEAKRDRALRLLAQAKTELQ